MPTNSIASCLSLPIKYFADVKAYYSHSCTVKLQPAVGPRGSTLPKVERYSGMELVLSFLEPGFPVMDNL